MNNRHDNDGCCIRCGKPVKRSRNKYCSRECAQKKNMPISNGCEELRRCPRCGSVKLLKSDFYIDKHNISGFSVYCKSCQSKKAKKYNSREDVKLKRKARPRNRSVAAAYEKKTLAHRRAKERSRRKKDSVFVLKSRMRCLMWQSLKGNKGGETWQNLVGYTTDDLRAHIERLFTKDMTWSAFLAGEIHIDHKQPVSSFNFSSPEDIEFKKCWALENLQPLWAEDNLKKGANWEQS